MLVETLGLQPSVVAQGDLLRRFVPIEIFLRRNPHRRQIEFAITNAATSGAGAVQRSEHGTWLIHTEPVIMTDGRVHGVHVWTGPPSTRRPPRPTIGAVVWDLTSGVATDTREALVNSGIGPDEHLDDRAFAEDLSIGDIHPEESAALALTMRCKPGETLAGTWNVTARHDGAPIRVSFISRALLESDRDGTGHMVIRAMNWRAPSESGVGTGSDLARQILRGMTQDGVHRALLDLTTWRLLKWLDPPCPHFDWRGEHSPRPMVHQDDESTLRAMTRQFSAGPAQGLLRLRSQKGWTLMHITMHRVELAANTFAGLIMIRLPTSAEHTEYAHSPMTAQRHRRTPGPAPA